VGEQHVDERRREEGVGDVVPPDQLQELAEVRGGHDDDLAAQRHDGETEYAGRVGERGEGEIHRPLAERVAHQRERRHGLQVAAGQHHALGPARGAAGADDHGEVAGGR
jgi:hypothetical protein